MILTIALSLSFTASAFARDREAEHRSPSTGEAEIVAVRYDAPKRSGVERKSLSAELVQRVEPKGPRDDAPLDLDSALVSPWFSGERRGIGVNVNLHW